jgi:hypothetical protein
VIFPWAWPNLPWLDEANGRGRDLQLRFQTAPFCKGQRTCGLLLAVIAEQRRSRDDDNGYRSAYKTQHQPG